MVWSTIKDGKVHLIYLAIGVGLNNHLLQSLHQNTSKSTFTMTMHHHLQLVELLHYSQALLHNV
jgi:hypothetical protein